MGACENRDGKVMAPGCYNGNGTYITKITYSSSPWGEDSDTLILCDDCRKMVGRDAANHSYEVVHKPVRKET